MAKTFEALPPGPGFAKTDGVNLRGSPGIDQPPLRELALGEAIDVGAATDDPRWRHVTVGGEKGFAAARYLRPPETAEIEALLHEAAHQWVRFDRGRGQEYEAPYSDYVGEMWRTVKPGSKLTGKDREAYWSAVFISQTVHRSGAKYGAFRLATGHSVFVHQAIQGRLFHAADLPFWGYRHTEQRPALGDIVARNREDFDYTYDYAETHSDYASHSDIVTEVNDASIRVIGGNVGQSVNTRDYRLDAAGFIAPGQRVIALLKNRAALC